MNGTFTVTGLTPFPLDMLRYDECFPVDAESVEAIQFSLDRALVREERKRSGSPVRHTVTLFTVKWGPTPQRWESFLWKVLPVSGE